MLRETFQAQMLLRKTCEESECQVHFVWKKIYGVNFLVHFVVMMICEEKIQSVLRVICEETIQSVLRVIFEDVQPQNDLKVICGVSLQLHFVLKETFGVDFLVQFVLKKIFEEVQKQTV